MKRAAKIIGAGIATFLLIFAAVGINTPNPDSSSSHFQALSPSDSSKQSADKLIEEPSKPAAPKITTKPDTKIVTIPYETTYVDDSSLAKGTTKVVQEGVDGTREDIYTVTYTDGIETDRELTSSTIIKQPVNHIIHNGTYVAPAPQSYCENGTYINSAGQTVCRPSTQNTGGATAICRDGSYSYSRSRRGTCSHHGGVRTWL